MLRSLADQETGRIYGGEFSRVDPPDQQNTARRKRVDLDEADARADLRAPRGHRREALKGKRAGQSRIRLYEQWRVGCRWKQPHADDVGLTDYH